MVFCAPGTTTYIQVDFTTQIPHEFPTLQLTVDAHNQVLGWVSQHGDGMLGAGYVTYEEYGLQLHWENSNNHQLIWGVVGSACFALFSYMNWLASTWAITAAVTFTVYDGQYQVGKGHITLL